MIKNWTEFWGLIGIATFLSLLCKFFSDTSFWLVFFGIVIPGLILEALNSISKSNEEDKNQQPGSDLPLPTISKEINTVKQIDNKKTLSPEKLEQIEEEKDKNMTDVEKSIKRHNKTKNKK